ncbi:swi5-dependent recombination DNA repair protein 1 homolog isoform X2 [Lissotriton helveticus]
MESPSAGSPSVCSTPPVLVSPAPLQSNLSAKQPMSAALRERLKKTRRSFSSFTNVAKRLKVDCEETDTTAPEDVFLVNKCPTSLQESIAEKSDDPPTQQDQPSLRPTIRTPLNSPHTISLGTDVKLRDLLEEKRKLMKKVQEKEELLRRLKMVKTYRSKNNLTELKSLIEKWRSSSQQLLYELQSALSTEGQKLSLSQLIDSCGLEDSLLHYNRAEEDFEEP